MASTGLTEQKPDGVQALERALVGSLMNGDVLPSQLNLNALCFTDLLCRRVYVLCEQMEREHRAISFEEIGMAFEGDDAVAVADVYVQRCVSAVLIGQYAQRVRDESIVRSLRAVLAEVLSKADSGNIVAQVEQLKARLDRLLDASAKGQDVGRNMFELICAVLDEIREPQRRPEPIATGVALLDAVLVGGFRPGDLAVVAALTSVGKSAMLAFMMRNAASQGKRVLLISCEMSDTQNAERYLAAISGIPLDAIIRRDALSDAQNEKISEGFELYAPANIQVVSSGTQTVASVRRAALAMKAGGGLDMIVVDYLQRLRPERPGGNKAEEVGAIAAGLKSLAVDLNVPVLTAAQFNREAAKGRREAAGQEKSGIPALHQLRDSSQIEDEANTVIILDEPRRLEGRWRGINAHVVKNRSGGLGAARLYFDGATMRYFPQEEEA